MSIPYIPLYVADYEADTAHLTLEEDGAYLRLLRLCWRTPGCSVPDDPKWIMRKMRISADDYYRVVEPLIEEYFTRGLGRVFSARLQREKDRIEETSQKRSEAGRKGGRPAKVLKTNNSGKSRAKAKQKQPEPEPEPELKGVNPLTPLEVLSGLLRPETASDFIAHRKAMKKPVTAEAAKRIVSKLKDCPDPDAVVDESIANGWQGVFPERSKPNGRNADGSAADLARRAGERFAARTVDRRPGDDPSQPLLPARQSGGSAGSGY